MLLTQETSANEPGDVVGEMRPPKMFQDKCAGHIKSFMANIVMCRAENEQVLTGNYNELVAVRRIFAL
jgi:hypothetical protein